MSLLPNAASGSTGNAARMALFAEAAYRRDTIPDDSRRQRFTSQFPNGRTVWWCHERATGLIYVDDKCVCIGIAGSIGNTDRDREGLTIPRQVRDWSETTGIPVPSDACEAGSTEGLLDFTTFCYLGIERAYYEHFSLTLAELCKPMWIAGHGLGGAAAQLLQCTTLFSHARAFVYGCPRVFLKRSNPPARLRVSVRRLTDPVSYLPSMSYHATAETLYVKYPGAISSRFPWTGWPGCLLCAAGAWAESWKGQGSNLSGHPMEHYLADLRPLLPAS